MQEVFPNKPPTEFLGKILSPKINLMGGYYDHPYDVIKEIEMRLLQNKSLKIKEIPRLQYDTVSNKLILLYGESEEGQSVSLKFSEVLGGMLGFEKTQLLKGETLVSSDTIGTTFKKPKGSRGTRDASTARIAGALTVLVPLAGFAFSIEEMQAPPKDDDPQALKEAREKYRELAERDKQKIIKGALSNKLNAWDPGEVDLPTVVPGLHVLSRKMSADGLFQPGDLFYVWPDVNNKHKGWKHPIGNENKLPHPQFNKTGPPYFTEIVSKAFAPYVSGEESNITLLRKSIAPLRKWVQEQGKLGSFKNEEGTMFYVVPTIDVDKDVPPQEAGTGVVSDVPSTISTMDTNEISEPHPFTFRGESTVESRGVTSSASRGPLLVSKHQGIVGTRPVDMNRGVHNLMIYSNVCDFTVVGDMKAQLLQTVEVPSGVSHGTQIVRRFETPDYLPVHSTHLQSITVSIKDDVGETVPFEFGRTSVRLHFKRRHSDYEEF